MKFSVSEITDLVRQRRTIYPKDYTDRVVHREIVERVLGNGTWAPTHGMTQPWRFKVFMGDARASPPSSERPPPEHPPDGVPATEVRQPDPAPAAEHRGGGRVHGARPAGQHHEQDDLLAMGCAVQNMHLTCAAYGLGGSLGHRGHPAGQGPCTSSWSSARNERPMGLFFMGYPAVEWPKGYRKPWTRS